MNENNEILTFFYYLDIFCRVLKYFFIFNPLHELSQRRPSRQPFYKHFFLQYTGKHILMKSNTESLYKYIFISYAYNIRNAQGRNV